MAKTQCRVCERDIAENPVTGNLRPHKIPKGKWAEVGGGYPYLDGQCPGAGSAGAYIAASLGR